MKKVLSKIVFGLLCMIPVIVQAESGIENFYVNAVRPVRREAFSSHRV